MPTKKKTPKVSLTVPRGCVIKHVEFGARMWTHVRVPNFVKSVGKLTKNEVAMLDEDNNLIYTRMGPNELIDLIHELSHWAYPNLEDDPVECPHCHLPFVVKDDLRRGDGLMTEALLSFGADLSAMLEGYE